LLRIILHTLNTIILCNAVNRIWCYCRW